MRFLVKTKDRMLSFSIGMDETVIEYFIPRRGEFNIKIKDDWYSVVFVNNTVAKKCLDALFAALKNNEDGLFDDADFIFDEADFIFDEADFAKCSHCCKKNIPKGIDGKRRSLTIGDREHEFCSSGCLETWVLANSKNQVLQNFYQGLVGEPGGSGGEVSITKP